MWLRCLWGLTLSTLETGSVSCRHVCDGAEELPQTQPMKHGMNVNCSISTLVTPGRLYSHYKCVVRSILLRMLLTEARQLHMNVYQRSSWPTAMSRDGNEWRLSSSAASGWIRTPRMINSKRWHEASRPQSGESTWEPRIKSEPSKVRSMSLNWSRMSVIRIERRTFRSDNRKFGKLD